MSERYESTYHIRRYLNGEISMGRLIYNMNLQSCYAQAADLIGGLLNEMEIDKTKLKTDQDN